MTLRILVVDDDPSTRKVLGRFLTTGDNDVDVCDAPEKALEHIRSSHYDVLLTDFVMPGMTGIELAGEAQKIRPGLRCMVMSGHVAADDVPLHIEWITKPIDIDALLASISRR